MTGLGPDNTSREPSGGNVGANRRKKSGDGEPIAVVGMACKFPGAPDVAALWRLLDAGKNAITEGEPGSGVGRIGQFYPRSAAQYPACRFAALVDEIDLFDAEFFRISPVEAQFLDPQQRMTLETCWQALENAAIDPERLRNTRSGVYIGISNNDYRGVSLASASQTSEPAASLYTVSGTSFNTVAGRVAYALGLEGPAIALDTACSSSLVAVHQAVTALRQGEADLMLVGGVQAIFSGRLTQLRAQAGMLSPDGQCKAFDSSANGFVRGEGCGVVVLKRLSDAQSDGDPIWGTILGTAINQDGASAGLTVPSADAQVKVIEDALLQAGIGPAEVDYLEAHGTGTEVGDPIELNSAAEAYGRGRPADRPLLVGSIKTNVGHLEPTAGVAGLMKTLLSMRHGVIPKHLHFNSPNPRVDWANLPVRISGQRTDWPLSPERPPRAGISSYGWSGTNAHVVVEGYGPPDLPVAGKAAISWPSGDSLPVSTYPSQGDAQSSGQDNALEERPARLLPLSGKSENALRDSARAYRAWLEEHGDESALGDLAWSAGVARSHFDFRDALVFRDAGSLAQGLDAVAGAPDPPPLQRAARVAFVYTGQGNQWAGMGAALYRHEPVFRAVMDRCDRCIREERGTSLLDVMFGRSGSESDLDEPRWTQPAIYALECSLTALWKSVGIGPVAVLGHSLGEIAAAQAAGVFSLEDGMKFASARGRLMGNLPRAGAMAAVFAPSAAVSEAVSQWRAVHIGSDLSIGVDNGTHQVISGPAAEVHAFADQLESGGVNVRRLRPSPAYHSPLVEPALDDLQAVFDDIPVSQPSLSLVSNVTGKLVGPDQTMDGAYWRQHARQPVRFASCVETLAAGLDVDAVIELGPHAILGPLVSLNWPPGASVADAPLVLQSMLRPPFDGSEPERADAFLSAVAGAYRAGLPVDFRGLFAGERRRKISIPGYPFQRRRFWVSAPERRVSEDSHPLLGTRHESPRGEVTFETDMYPSDPSWLQHHRVYGRVIMPGALFGAMAADVSGTEGGSGLAIDELQLLNPLVYPEFDGEGGSEEPGKRISLVVDGANGSQPRRFEIFSKGDRDESWVLHAEGLLSPSDGRPAPAERIDLESLKAGLLPQDSSAYYRSKAATGIDLGPSFRTLEALWGDRGEALAEVCLRGPDEGYNTAAHPLVLDGCFQVLSAARHLSDFGGEATYLPFAWERLWLNGPMPESLVCHARLRQETPETALAEAASAPETLTGDLVFYSTDGIALGGLTGFTLKRANRSSLFSSTEGLQDLLYEVAWRDRPLRDRLRPAMELAAPSAVAAETDAFVEYLAREGVHVDHRAALLSGLEQLSCAYSLAALERLGWSRRAGASIDPEQLTEDLGVIPQHSRLLERMLRLLSDAGVLEKAPGPQYRVLLGEGDPLPGDDLADPEAFAGRLAELHPHGVNELGLLQRSGGALAEVLQGDVDPLSILFPREGPGASDFYFTAPASRASNRLMGDAVAALVANWPQDRRLRILEIGAGTGSGTSVVLPELPENNFDYVFTDISAGFFAEAENRFRDSGAPLEYRPLDIERDPAAQGFDLHAYDLVIAVNVLHATRDLGETLGHCRDLLAASGQLVAVESLRGRGWQDMTFGQLDGWWRYSDAYRPEHAIASPGTWRQALLDAGFQDPVVLGGESRSEHEGPLGSGVIIAQGPPAVSWPPGLWVVLEDDDAITTPLAAALASKNQAVVVTGRNSCEAQNADPALITHAPVAPDDRTSWRKLLQGLPKDLPLQGIVHGSSLAGHGINATTQELAEGAQKATASALALVQALQDCDMTPARGVWFITRGAQSLERDYGRKVAADLAGSLLWGFGKAVAREAGYLQARMIDLDPDLDPSPEDLVNELMFPDQETHIAWRSGNRLAARLVRTGANRPRITLPEDRNWRLVPTAGQGLEGLHAGPATPRALNSGEVRVAVEAAGLNFSDVLISVGAVEMDPMLGDEFCGRVTEVAPDVSHFQVGDRVLGLGIGTFRPDLITRAEMAVPAPEGIRPAALATIPTSFVSAELAFQMSGLNDGDRVLIHTASGGVGLAAIQLARAAGAEVFATASAPKQAFLRSLGIEHVFDSRTTDFAPQMLAATGGKGVDVVLNSLTGPGFIESSLSCLAPGGSFVEMGRRDIWTTEQMASERPDIAYHILEVDALKRRNPAAAGASLRRVMARVTAGELTPLTLTRWPMTEIIPAMEFMRSARHVGKNVIIMPRMAGGRLRSDRTYLVTGGLGGIGTVIARWLAERGAGVIVLNGRRPPDPEAQEVIDALRRQGADVRVELADMTSPAAIDQMLARVDSNMPPLAGVIHSVGVLSDGSLGNQTWERFQQVLWPKVLGAWHLHQATLDKDLDLFVLFSSITGVVGNSGQGNHAAANAYLDQLAGYRRSLGLPGQSIAWGAWSGLGEAEEQRERIERQLEASGTHWISPQQGLEAFEELVRRDFTFGMVASVDWPVLADNFDEPPSFLAELLLDEEESAASSNGSSAADLLSQLREGPPDAWDDILVPFLQRELQAVLRLPAAPAPTVGFFDLGMDSLMAVELRNRLNRTLAGQYTVSNTAVFDYPNVVALAGHLGAELKPVFRSPTLEPVEAYNFRRTERPVNTSGDSIAIVGMACRFPGSPNLEAFWDLLETGRHAVTDGRPDAGPWEGLPGDPAAQDAIFRRGGFVNDLDRFDHRFFQISPIEARLMDPQQRMLLETTWHALEDAGTNPETLRRSRTGCYVGLGSSEYRDVISAKGEDDLYFGTSGALTVGRVAFVLGLEGPAMPVDMACASSLAALHHAVAALQRGEVDLALVGGVNATLSMAVARFHRDMGMLSKSGQCNAFDSAADGFVRSEGCGVLVLKHLSQAEAGGNRIWGLVKGTAVNQSGDSAALPVPNGPAQERVMEDALAMAGVDPAGVDYLEAHGTGTELGDSIELRALASVYGRGREPERPLLLGSVKTNIGHTEWASGMASIIKAVLAMQRRVIPAHLHFRNPNPNFDWEQLPVRITSEKAPWPAFPDRPPRSAVNTFGLSGTNAHVVLEGCPRSISDLDSDPESDGESVPPSGQPQPVPLVLPAQCGDIPTLDEPGPVRTSRILPLSGKSPEALRRLAEAYLSWLDRSQVKQASETSPSEFLADMAWTAGTGRSHFSHRAGVVFDDSAGLRAGLYKVMENANGPAEPEVPRSLRVAFLYSGLDNPWAGLGEDLYRTEPVFRAVLDRCDQLVRLETGQSLLEVMFGDSVAGERLCQPDWANSALYALQVALTALWESIGILPSAVLGRGIGEIAAAHAAQVLSLEGGMKLAAALTGPEAALPVVPVASPALTWVSGINGGPVQDIAKVDNAFWRRLADSKDAFEDGSKALIQAGVDLAVALDLVAGGSEMVDLAPIPVLGCRLSPGVDSSRGPGRFLQAVAAAYEAGVKVSFPGLFAGEERRRIAIPEYPFQRRSFWVRERKTTR